MAFRIRCPECSEVYTAGEDHRCVAKAKRPGKIASVGDARKNLHETVASIERGGKPGQELLGTAADAMDRQVAGAIVPGQPCPTCGKPVGKTHAQRQRAYRERRRNAEG